MRSTDVFKGKFLRGPDAANPLLAQIDHLTVETVGQGEQADDKPVLHFKGDVSPMVLNKSNFQTIEDAYGDSDDWGGKWIEVFFDPNVSYAGKRTGGLRVRTVAGPNGNGNGNGGAAPSWTWAEAVNACKAAGISEDELKGQLKVCNMTKWNAAAVAEAKRFISVRRTAMDAAAVGGPHEAVTEDDIPF